MNNHDVLVPRQTIELMLTQMNRAERYCRNARSFTLTDEDFNADATDFYPGASGYAGSTLRYCISDLKSFL